MKRNMNVVGYANGETKQKDESFELLDSRGAPVTPATPTFMARLDVKASEKIEVSRGTLWFVGTVLVLLGVVFSYGSSMLSWVRDDESQRVKMANIERQVEELNRKFDDMQKAMTAQAIKDAETKGKEFGYQVGRSDKTGGH